MHLRELDTVNLGSLDNLDFSDSNILDGIDGGHLLSDLLLNELRGEQVQDLVGVGFRDLLGDDLVNSVTDRLLLRAESVVGLALLVEGFLGKGDSENSKHITILRLDVLDCLDKSFALLNKGAELVASHVDSVEAGECISASGVIDDELDLSPSIGVLSWCEICLHSLNNSALNAVFNLF